VAGRGAELKAVEAPDLACRKKKKGTTTIP